MHSTLFIFAHHTRAHNSLSAILRLCGFVLQYMDWRMRTLLPDSPSHFCRQLKLSFDDFTRRPIPETEQTRIKCVLLTAQVRILSRDRV